MPAAVDNRTLPTAAKDSATRGHHSFPNCSCEPGAPLAVDHRLTALRPNRNGDQAPSPPSSSTSSRITEAAFRLRSGARTVVRPRATRSRSSRSSLAWAKPDAGLRTFAGPTSRGLRATRTRLLLRLRTTSSHGAQAPGGFRFNLMISQAWQRTTTSRTPRRPNANAAIPGAQNRVGLVNIDVACDVPAIDDAGPIGVPSFQDPGLNPTGDSRLPKQVAHDLRMLCRNVGQPNLLRDGHDGASDSCTWPFPDCPSRTYETITVSSGSWRRTAVNESSTVAVYAHHCEIGIGVGSYHRPRSRRPPANATSSWRDPPTACSLVRMTPSERYTAGTFTALVVLRNGVEHLFARTLGSPAHRWRRDSIPGSFWRCHLCLRC